mmetsp:Transcript_39417/g.98661  ORF Transcript_39417/g.98661 Transcript_39417/m.98661 type:complete len:303 (-) Transcript_39417:39-947(-)
MDGRKNRQQGKTRAMPPPHSSISFVKPPFSPGHTRNPIQRAIDPPHVRTSLHTPARSDSPDGHTHTLTLQTTEPNTTPRQCTSLSHLLSYFFFLAPALALALAFFFPFGCGSFVPNTSAQATVCSYSCLPVSHKGGGNKSSRCLCPFSLAQYEAFLPPLSRALPSAPWASSSFVRSVLPSLQATWRGVCRVALGVQGSAPRDSKSDAVCTWLLKHAKWRGVLPPILADSWASTSAPFAMRNSHSSLLPSRAARCRAVVPMTDLALTSACCATAVASFWASCPGEEGGPSNRYRCSVSWISTA